MKATLTYAHELLLPFEPAGNVTYEITLGRLLTWRSQLGLGIIGHSATGDMGGPATGSNGDA